MNEQERCDAFMAGLAALEQQYGVAVGAELSTKQYGHMLQVEPEIQLVPVPNWQPPVDQPTSV